MHRRRGPSVRSSSTARATTSLPVHRRAPGAIDRSMLNASDGGASAFDDKCGNELTGHTSKRRAAETLEAEHEGQQPCAVAAEPVPECPGGARDDAREVHDEG